MKFNPVQRLLKNGHSVLIRAATSEDAERVIRHVQGFVYAAPYVPISEGEFNPTISEEMRFLQQSEERANSLFLVAESAGEIIGNIFLEGNQRKVMFHTAMVGIGMLASWKGCGLGFALMDEAIKWAREKSDLEMLWLKVYAENEPGIQLYRKCGFVEYGRLPGMFKQNGRYHDEVSMYLSL